MEPEKVERLRQYVAGMSEISAGDQLVLRHLRGKTRERQRFALGLPLLILGAGGLYALARRRWPIP
jgi:zinc/manganese transport system permease protein